MLNKCIKKNLNFINIILEEKLICEHTWRPLCLSAINTRSVLPRNFFFGNSKLKPYSFNVLLRSTNSRKRFLIIHEDDGSSDKRVTRIEYSYSLVMRSIFLNKNKQILFITPCPSTTYELSMTHVIGSRASIGECILAVPWGTIKRAIYVMFLHHWSKYIKHQQCHIFHTLEMRPRVVTGRKNTRPVRSGRCNLWTGPVRPV